jgi:flagellar biosynthesis anti-sigma factor FlgM
MSYTNGIGLQQALNSIAPTSAKPAGDTSTNETTSSYVLERADQANLSSASGIVAQALESSDTRSAKVAALQQTITSGSYKVSSSAVAAKMIDSLLD